MTAETQPRHDPRTLTSCPTCKRTATMERVDYGYKIIQNEYDGVWLLFAYRPWESDDPGGWDEIENGYPSATAALEAALELEEREN